MNKYEGYYCSEIARLNLLFNDVFSKDFLEKVAGPITDIIFECMTDNNSEFSDFIKEVGLDEIIQNNNTNF
ncbi:MAG: hypothetical protein J6S67_17490 [Methanobrevibacter sp.]|nr:hypothetical protein [Methanobrevibacter sp.]